MDRNSLENQCSITENFGYEFKSLNAVVLANKRQKELLVGKIRHLVGELKGKQIGILGFIFKQNTDDILKILLEEGANIKCFDPLAMENTKKVLPLNKIKIIHYCKLD